MMLTFCACGSSGAEETAQGRGITDTELGAEGRTSGKTPSLEAENQEAEDDIELSDPEFDYSDITYVNADDALDLELVETFSYIDHGYGSYLNYCGIIKNPNEDLIANFPEMTVTVKDDTGSILASDTYMGGIIMPEDEITMISFCEVPGITETDDLTVEFEVECDEFTDKSFYYPECLTTDFLITNISELEGESYHVTGEITNTYSENIDNMDLSLLLRKDGEIVFMWSDYMDGLKSQKTKPFDIQCYADIPEHDEVEVRVQSW